MAHVLNASAIEVFNMSIDHPSHRSQVVARVHVAPRLGAIVRIPIHGPPTRIEVGRFHDEISGDDPSFKWAAGGGENQKLRGTSHLGSLENTESAKPLEGSFRGWQLDVITPNEDGIDALRGKH
jgi:hypothetical protein